MGNLYKVEGLFLARVSPWTPAHEVADLRGLVNLLHRLLDRNKEFPEQPTTGDPRRGRDHWVYERAGRPCRRCGTTLLLAEQGPAPQARLTFWCPRCQPGPAPAPMSTADRTAVEPQTRRRGPRP